MRGEAKAQQPSLAVGACVFGWFIQSSSCSTRMFLDEPAGWSGTDVDPLAECREPVGRVVVDDLEDDDLGAGGGERVVDDRPVAHLAAGVAVGVVPVPDVVAGRDVARRGAAVEVDRLVDDRGGRRVGPGDDGQGLGGCDHAADGGEGGEGGEPTLLRCRESCDAAFHFATHTACLLWHSYHFSDMVPR